VGIALEEIKKNGPFAATVVQDWPKVLNLVVDDMKAYAETDALPSKNFVETDVTLVDRTNVDSIKPTD
jgi:ribose transport system substrate-binding protein